MNAILFKEATNVDPNQSCVLINLSLKFVGLEELFRESQNVDRANDLKPNR